MQTPGGAGTYYAGVIYEAQSSLIAQSTANPNTKNVMVILSDGDASSGSGSNSAICREAFACLTPLVSQLRITALPILPCKINAPRPSPPPNMRRPGHHGLYIAYGSPGSGCSTDVYNNKTNHGRHGNYSLPGNAADVDRLAISTSDFYSDSTAAGGGACSALNGALGLNTIFSDLAAQFSAARLVPNNISSRVRETFSTRAGDHSSPARFVWFARINSARNRRKCPWTVFQRARSLSALEIHLIGPEEAC